MSRTTYRCPACGGVIIQSVELERLGDPDIYGFAGNLWHDTEPVEPACRWAMEALAEEIRARLSATANRFIGDKEGNEA